MVNVTNGFWKIKKNNWFEQRIIWSIVLKNNCKGMISFRVRKRDHAQESSRYF
mgnify:CR=1 FL=1